MFRLAHSLLRYGILALAVSCIVYAAYGLIARREHDRPMRRLASALSGTLFAQLLLGFAVLFSGRVYGAMVAHIFAALGAALAAQLPVSVMRRRPAAERTYGLHLAASVVVLTLVLVGIMAVGAPVAGPAGGP